MSQRDNAESRAGRPRGVVSRLTCRAPSAVVGYEEQVTENGISDTDIFRHISVLCPRSPSGPSHPPNPASLAGPHPRPNPTPRPVPRHPPPRPEGGRTRKAAVLEGGRAGRVASA
ncbi:hypothetical protein GCM10018953_35470 [Streptosporangium nondiastaticum]